MKPLLGHTIIMLNNSIFEHVFLLIISLVKGVACVFISHGTCSILGSFFITSILICFIWHRSVVWSFSSKVDSIDFSWPVVKWKWEFSKKKCILVEYGLRLTSRINSRQLTGVVNKYFRYPNQRIRLFIFNTHLTWIIQ